MSKKHKKNHGDNGPHSYGERSVVLVHTETGFEYEGDLYYPQWREQALIDVGTGPFPYSHWTALGYRLDNDD